MTVKHTQAPRRQHEEARSRKENANELDREFARCRIEAGRKQSHKESRREYARENYDRRSQRQQREDRIGHSGGFLFVAARQQICVTGSEGGRERAFTKTVREKIGDRECRAEGARRVRETEIVSEDALSNHADDSPNEYPDRKSTRLNP